MPQERSLAEMLYVAAAQGIASGAVAIMNERTQTKDVGSRVVSVLKDVDWPQMWMACQLAASAARPARPRPAPVAPPPSYEPAPLRDLELDEAPPEPAYVPEPPSLGPDDAPERVYERLTGRGAV